MTFEEYTNKFREAQLAGKLSENAKPWSEEDFNFFSSPIKKTAALADDPMFRLGYKSIYLSLRKSIEGGMAADKEEQLKMLDGIYQEVAEKLNLL